VGLAALGVVVRPSFDAPPKKQSLPNTFRH
jgi:hypothetical protein